MSTHGNLKIFLIDDHGAVRAGLRVLVEQVSDFDVVGEAGDGRSAIEAIRANPPDVVITDLSMSEMDGLQTIAEIRRVAPRIQVLVFSMHSQPEQVRRALAAGAHGYVAKADEWRELVAAVRTLGRGEQYLSAAVADWQSRAGDSRLTNLTPRQREILQLIAEGYRTRQIADHLGVAVKTVDTHRTQLMQRLNIHDIAGLTRFALEVGMISVPTAPLDQ